MSETTSYQVVLEVKVLTRRSSRVLALNQADFDARIGEIHALVGENGAGYGYILVDQKSSELTMVSATIDMINQGIDPLITSPVKPDALGPIVDAAKAKGIPIVVDDIGSCSAAYDAIVILNNYEGGELAAAQMDKLIAAGKPRIVASITCEASAVYAARHNQRFEDKIKELGYEVVVASLSANSKDEEGYQVIQNVDLATKVMAGETLKCDNADAREIFVPVKLITMNNLPK